jgi:quinol monooxygenase YgiN
MTTTTGIMSAFTMVAIAAGAGGCAGDDAEPATAVRVALLVRLEAKVGHEAEVAALLQGGRDLVLEEPGTPYWLAVQLGPQTFGIFDAFGGDPERQAHLAGKLAQALLAKAPEVLAKDPVIEPVDIIGQKYELAGAPAPLRVGLLVRMEAQAGREAELAALVEQGPAIVAGEPGTPLWFGIRIGPTTFGIFDAFADADARQAHLEGQLAQTLVGRAPELLAGAPTIEPLDVLATKLP